MKNCDLIVKGKYILPMDEKLPIIKDGFVAVSKNKIAATGAVCEIANYHADEVIDVGNSIVMPGLINTHTHAAMAYFRGLADDLPLDVWLEKHIWPAEAKNINHEFIKKSSELAILEMLKSGITCFNDMYFYEEVTAEAAKKAGIRAVIGEGILNFPTPSCKTPDETMDKTIELAEKYKDDELISAAMAPHSIYACDKKVLIKTKEIAEKYNLPIHIHVSETKKEAEDCKNQHGKSPVEYLDELGILSEKLIAAHSVWLSGSDLKIYKNRGVKAAHCPISNMKLASGAAHVGRMLEFGIPVGLGTDGAASNNTLDLFSDMRACALLHKVNELDPEAASAKEVVKMATIKGAEVLGMEKEIGSLETGKKADIITINLDKPHLTPIYDPYSHLVYCVNGDDVENSIVNGKIIMRNRKVKTLDEKKILSQAHEFF